MNYGGDHSRSGIVAWLQNPTAPKPPEAEVAWSETVSDVVHLTSDTFNRTLTESPSSLVMFYAPWCGHCKALKPHYEKAAAEIKSVGYAQMNRVNPFPEPVSACQPLNAHFSLGFCQVPGILAAIDATVETSLASQFDVTGYPTLKYFRDGRYQFDAAALRSSDALVSFMQSPKEPPPPIQDVPWSEEDPLSAVLHLSEATFLSSLKTRKHALVMFYAPWCGHCKKTKPEFTGAADKFRNSLKVVFAALDCTQAQSVCDGFSIRGFPTFKYFSYGELQQDYLGGRQEADFVEFISQYVPNESVNVGDIKSGVDNEDHENEQAAQGEDALLKEAEGQKQKDTEKLDEKKKEQAQAETEKLKETQEFDNRLKREASENEERLEKESDALRQKEARELQAQLEKETEAQKLKEAQELEERSKKEAQAQREYAEHLKIKKEVIEQKEDHERQVELKRETEARELKKAQESEARLKQAAEAQRQKDAHERAKIEAEIKKQKDTQRGQKRKEESESYVDEKAKENEQTYRTTKDQKQPVTEELREKTVSQESEEDRPPPQANEWPELPGSENVLFLNGNNFHFAISSINRAVVFFYAPWCGHCKKMKPTFAEAAGHLTDDGFKNRRLVAVNCQAEQALCQEFGVRGYPTIRLFENGEMSPEKFPGPRTVGGITNFLTSAAEKAPLDDPVVTFTPNQLSQLPDGYTLILFQKPGTAASDRVRQELARVEKQKQRLSLASVDCHLYSEACVSHLQDRGPPLMRLFSGRRWISDFSGPFDADTIMNFLKKFMVDPVKIEL